MSEELDLSPILMEIIPDYVAVKSDGESKILFSVNEALRVDQDIDVAASAFAVLERVKAIEVRY